MVLVMWNGKTDAGLHGIRFILEKKELCCSTASLKARLRLLQATVFQSFSWGTECLNPTEKELARLDTLQLKMAHKMLGRKRKPGEGWLDFYKRTIGHARQTIHKPSFSRWSRMWHFKYLSFTGRVARLLDTRLALKCLMYRDLAWWKNDQNKLHGVRHQGQFKVWRWETRVFTEMSSEEMPWRSLAKNNEKWRICAMQIAGVTRAPMSNAPG